MAEESPSKLPDSGISVEMVVDEIAEIESRTGLSETDSKTAVVVEKYGDCDVLEFNQTTTKSILEIEEQGDKECKTGNPRVMDVVIRVVHEKGVIDGFGFEVDEAKDDQSLQDNTLCHDIKLSIFEIGESVLKIHESLSTDKTFSDLLSSLKPHKNGDEIYLDWHHLSGGVCNIEACSTFLSMIQEEKNYRILTKPSLCLLDAPIVGLDSTAAFFIIRQMTRDGDKTIVSSIHQPRSEVLTLFDDLYLLSVGETIYFGDAKRATKFFSEVGLRCPIKRNPSGHFLLCISSNFDRVDATLKGSLKHIAEAESDSSSNSLLGLATMEIKALLIVHKQLIRHGFNAFVVPALIPKEEGTILDAGGSQANFLMQSYVLTKRSFVNMSKDFGYYWMRLIIYLVVTVCIRTCPKILVIGISNHEVNIELHSKFKYPSNLFTNNSKVTLPRVFNTSLSSSKASSFTPEFFENSLISPQTLNPENSTFAPSTNESETQHTLYNDYNDMFDGMDLDLNPMILKRNCWDDFTLPIVPNGAKCSIEALLDCTIRHLLFLQSVTNYAEKLKQADEPKIIGEESDVVLKDNTNGGLEAPWAYEVAGQTVVCPILIEDLHPAGQMLVEMFCEERGVYLEIADEVNGRQLPSLKIFFWNVQRYYTNTYTDPLKQDAIHEGHSDLREHKCSRLKFLFVQEIRHIPGRYLETRKMAISINLYSMSRALQNSLIFIAFLFYGNSCAEEIYESA